MTPSDVLVRAYFDRAASADLEAYFDLFSSEAQVEDEGREYHGIAEIRAWRTSVPDVSYDVVELSDDAGITTARTRISGDFPGIPVMLTFRLTPDSSGLIRQLTIRP